MSNVPAAADRSEDVADAEWDLSDGPRMETLLSALQRNPPAHPDHEDGR